MGFSAFIMKKKKHLSYLFKREMSIFPFLLNWLIVGLYGWLIVGLYMAYSWLISPPMNNQYLCQCPRDESTARL